MRVQENKASFVAGYRECLLWTEVNADRDDFDGKPCMDTGEFSEEADEKIINDCFEFLGYAYDIIVAAWVESSRSMGIAMFFEYAGHDFWLTRNGHGTGYWDKPELYGDYADKLDELSKSFGESYVWPSECGEYIDVE